VLTAEPEDRSIEDRS